MSIRDGARRGLGGLHRVGLAILPPQLLPASAATGVAMDEVHHTDGDFLAAVTAAFDSALVRPSVGPRIRNDDKAVVPLVDRGMLPAMRLLGAPNLEPKASAGTGVAVAHAGGFDDDLVAARAPGLDHSAPTRDFDWGDDGEPLALHRFHVHLLFATIAPFDCGHRERSDANHLLAKVRLVRSFPGVKADERNPVARAVAIVVLSATPLCILSFALMHNLLPNHLRHSRLPSCVHMSQHRSPAHLTLCTPISVRTSQTSASLAATHCAPKMQACMFSAHVIIGIGYGLRW